MTASSDNYQLESSTVIGFLDMLLGIARKNERNRQSSKKECSGAEKLSEEQAVIRTKSILKKQ